MATVEDMKEQTIQEIFKKTAERTNDLMKSLEIPKEKHECKSVLALFLYPLVADEIYRKERRQL